jgi:hypothetical protein
MPQKARLRVSFPGEGPGAGYIGQEAVLTGCKRLISSGELYILPFNQL